MTSTHHPIPHPSSSTKDLLYYLEVVVRNWRMIAIVTTAAAFLCIIISLCRPNIYRSTAKILPPQQDASGLMGLLMGTSGGLNGMGGMAADLLGKGSASDMYVSILNSEAISDRIIDRFKLMDVYDQKYRVPTYAALSKNLNITAGKKDGIISISVEDKDPKLATEVANAYVDELAKLTAKLNLADARHTRVFYEDRLAKAKSELAGAEDALKVFQRKNKAIDVTEQAKGSIKGVAELEAQLALEEVKLAGFRQSFTDSAQEVKAQRAVISNIKAQIAKFEGDRTGVAIPGVGSVPELGQQYLRLMRDFKIQESIVDLLTKQYEISSLSEAKDFTSIQVIQTARVPDRKAKPKRAILVLMGTFIAFSFSVSYAFLKEHLANLSETDKHRLLTLKDHLALPTVNSFRK